MKTHVIVAVSASMDLVASLVLYIAGLQLIAGIMAVVAILGYAIAFVFWQRSGQR